MADTGALVAQLEKQNKAIKDLRLKIHSTEGEVQNVMDTIDATDERAAECDAHYARLTHLMNESKDLKAEQEVLEIARGGNYEDLKATRVRVTVGDIKPSLIEAISPTISTPKCQRDPASLTWADGSTRPSPVTIRSASSTKITPSTKVTASNKRRCIKGVKTQNWDRMAIIADTHPTIIPSPDGQGYIELRCGFCGTNCSSRAGLFIRGATGFAAHYAGSQDHRSALGKGEETFTAKAVAELCTYKRLTGSEAQAILAGDEDAYVVEKVGCKCEESKGPTGDGFDAD